MFKRFLLGIFAIATPFVWGAQSVNLTWDASPDPTVVGYSVYYGSAPGNYTNRLDAGAALTISTPPLADGVYYFSTTSRDANGNESDFANTITTNISTVVSGTAPTITTQPTSITAASGSSTTFSVGVSGTTPISYQWRFNGTDIIGATSGTFTISSVQSSNVGTYTCYVSNTAGSVTSIAATLTIASGTAPTIVTQPRDANSLSGGNVSFSIAASGSSVAYQWYRNGVALVDGGNCNGATNSTLNLSPVTSFDANNYNVRVSNPWGTVYSIYVVLNVSNAPTVVAPSIVSQPVSALVIPGNSATFNVVASGTAPFAYQWLFNGSNIVGATNSTFSIASVQSTNAGSYTCNVSNSAGSTTSAAATLTLASGTLPVIVTQPSDANSLSGGNVSFSVAANGSSLAYQWYRNGVALTDGGNCNGATNSTLNLSPVTSFDANNYNVRVSNPWGTVYSIYVVLNVTNAPTILPPTIVTQPASQTVSATSNFSLTVSMSGTSTYSYQWSKDGSPISNATNATYTVTNALRANAGGYVVTVTGNGTVTSGSAIVTVNDPVFYLQPVGKTVFTGESCTFTAAANGTQPLNYQWFVAKPDSTGLLVGKTNTSLTLSSVTTNDAGTYYCVANNGNIVSSSNAVLTVYVSGTYNGLFADSINVSNASSGALLNFIVSTNASYSGKIDIAGTSYSLSGKFNSTGSSSNLVTRTRGNVVVLLGFDNQPGTIDGTVSCAAESWSVPLRAQTAGYSASNPTQASGNNVNFVDFNNAIGGQVFITNTIAGAVKMTGKLADSTKISISASLTGRDEFPVHVDLYSKTGMLHGWVSLSNGIPGGTLMWIRPGAPNDSLNVVKP